MKDAASNARSGASWAAGGHGRRRRDRRGAAVECRLRRHRKPGGRRRRAARDLTTRRHSFRRRLWSQTISPVLEKPNTAAAEAELAGRAESLVDEAILEAERARLSSAGDITKTTWGCVLLGFADPEARHCSERPRMPEAAVKREPSNPNVWESLTRSSTRRGSGAGDCRPRRVRGARPISPTWCCRRRCTQKICDLERPRAVLVALGYYATCNADRVRIEAGKAAALNTYNAGMLGGLSYMSVHRSLGRGESARRKSHEAGRPDRRSDWWWPAAKQAWFRGETKWLMKIFSALT